MASSQATDSDGDPLREESQLASAAGGAVTAYGQWQSGKVNQQIAQFNANQARLRADQQEQAGVYAANRRQMVQDQLAGRTTAAQAGGGTVVGAGTNRLVQQGQENASAMDKMLIQLNADRSAGATRVQASGEDLQGDMARRAGESSAFSTLIGAGATQELLQDPSYDPRVRPMV